MTALQALSLAPMPALALAALSDVAARRVPNWISAVVAVCGIGARFESGDLLLSAGLSSAVFLLLFACWRRGWLGGGDVKLLAACALLVPAYAVPGLLLTVALAGGLLALAYLLGRAILTAGPGRQHPRSAGRLQRLCRVEGWRIRRQASLPYACAIVAGSAFTLAVG